MGSPLESLNFEPEKRSIFDQVSEKALDFVRAVGNSAIQQPVDGISQLVNHIAGKRVIGEVHLIDAPKQAEFGSFDWHVQQIGGALGLVLPFGLLNKGVRSGGGMLGNAVRFAGMGRALEAPLVRVALPILEAGTTGAAFEGLLRPVQQGEGDFTGTRVKNAIAGAFTFSTLQATTMGLKGISTWRYAESSPWLINTTRRDLGRHLLAGGVAGLMDAEVRSLLDGKGHAKLSALGESAYGFMFVGGALRLGKLGTDSARGRQSVADMVAGDKALQQVIKDSPTAKRMIAGLGEVSVTTERKAGSPDMQVSESLTGDRVIKLSADLMKSTDAVARGQMLVRGLAHMEASARNPLTWRHAAKESAYAGMMTSRAKVSAARELNFVQELAASRGEPATLNARKTAVDRWAEVAEESKIHQKMKEEHKARFGPLVERLSRFNFLKRFLDRVGSSIADKEHLLALKEFDVKSKDAEARESYQANMGPGDGKQAGGTVRNEKLERVKHLIPEGAQIIVDMGAGGGQFARAVKSIRPRAEVVALDLSGQMVADLKASRGKDNIDLRVEHGDAMLPDFPRESVDVITGNSHTHEILSYPDIGLGHYRMEHLREMFGNYSQMLKPGGRVLIQDFIIPRYGNYQGNFRINFRTPEARAYFEKFTADLAKSPQELNIDHMMPAPEFQRLGETANKPNGSIEASAQATGEFLLSSMYGMRMQEFGWPKNEPWQHPGVLMEKFANLSRDGMVGIIKDSAPEGYSMKPIHVDSYTSPDYLQHWTQHFEIEIQGPDGRWSPIADMNNLHTRVVVGAEKVPNRFTSLLPSFLRGHLPTMANRPTESMYRFVAPGSLLPNQLRVLAQPLNYVNDEVGDFWSPEQLQKMTPAGKPVTL